MSNTNTKHTHHFSAIEKRLWCTIQIFFQGVTQFCDIQSDILSIVLQILLIFFRMQNATSEKFVRYFISLANHFLLLFPVFFVVSLKYINCSAAPWRVLIEFGSNNTVDRIQHVHNTLPPFCQQKYICEPLSENIVFVLLKFKRIVPHCSNIFVSSIKKTVLASDKMISVRGKHDFSYVLI